MIYDKLTVVFLSALATEKPGSTNAVIARYILNHIDELQEIGIKDLAKRTNVAVSSISRFCKEIGLNDFNELKMLLSEYQVSFQYELTGETLSSQMHHYTDAVKESIDWVVDSLDYRQLQHLVDDLSKYQHVYAFGLLKAEGVAINLQSDLLMLQKPIVTHVAFNEQMNALTQMSEDDLVIIFSYTGTYFDSKAFRSYQKHLYHPKIWMICSENEHHYDYVDEYLTFESKKNQLSHPYQLQIVEGMIAQLYGQKKKA